MIKVIYYDIVYIYFIVIGGNNYASSNATIVSNGTVIIFIFTMLYVLAKDGNAARSVYLNCWWSDVNEVFYHQSQPVMCYKSAVSDSLLTAERIKNYCRAGFTQWGSATGFSIAETTSPTSADILIDGVSRATAFSHGVEITAYAAVLPTNTTYVDVGIYNGKNYTIRKFAARVNVLFIENSMNSESEWRKVAVHEIGHALGYTGHFNGGYVMTQYFEDIQSRPSTKEFNHLGQIYDRF